MHEASDEEVPEELDTEKDTEKDTGKDTGKDVGKGKGGMKSSKKRLRTALLIADAPVTLHQYQSTLKEKLEHLYGHRQGEREAEQGEGPLTSASWQSMTEDWIRVPNR